MEIAIANFLEITGLGIFLYYLIRGLKVKVSGLEETVRIQNQILSVMEKRIQETEKVGNIYKNLMAELPADLDNYKAVLTKTKDETIIELMNQQDAMRKKLADAEKAIKESGNSEAVIAMHLRALKNLMSNKKRKDLLILAEFNGRTAEDAIRLMLSSDTLNEYLEKHGYEIITSSDDRVLQEMFGGMDQGKPKDFEVGVGGWGLDGWYAIKDDEFHVSPEKLSRLKDEFSAVKTI